MPDPLPMSMFDHVFAEETEELRIEREGFAAVPRELRGGTVNEARDRIGPHPTAGRDSAVGLRANQKALS